MHSTLFDKEKLNEYFENNPSLFIEYINQLDFEDLTFVQALRKALLFGIPKKSVTIDQLADKIGDKYYAVCSKQSNNIFKSSESVYTLAYCVILLSNDITCSQNNKTKKMTEKDFIVNCRGCNQSENFPDIFMKDIYQQITSNPLI